MKLEGSEMTIEWPAIEELEQARDDLAYWTSLLAPGWTVIGFTDRYSAQVQKRGATWTATIRREHLLALGIEKE